jgi:putative N6-adenine-specific DNA methylase
MDTEFIMVAKTMFGLEELLAKELEELGAKEITILKRAVQFKGDMKLLYRANYCLRTALAILKPLQSFTARSDQELYDHVYKIEWEKYMNPDGTMYIDASVNSNIFKHSLYAAQKTKDAICDRFRKMFDVRPSIEKDYVDLKIDLHIYDNQVTISLNSSGESLHKRGYRQEVGSAPLNEVTAAGLIQLSGWQKDCNFYDPMCGSGTIAIEAAMYANNIPAQYYRKYFGFKKWSEFNAVDWKNEKEIADSKISEFDYEIWASDVSGSAIERADKNIRFAHLNHDINLFRAAIEDGKRPDGKTFVITNPPYGERMEVDDIIDLYQRIGDSLKQNFQDCTAFIISSDIFALKKIGLKPTRKIEVFNGNLECRLFKFEIYSGSKKAKYNIDNQEREQENNIE